MCNQDQIHDRLMDIINKVTKFGLRKVYFSNEHLAKVSCFTVRCSILEVKVMDAILLKVMILVAWIS